MADNPFSAEQIHEWGMNDLPSNSDTSMMEMDDSGAVQFVMPGLGIELTVPTTHPLITGEHLAAPEEASSPKIASGEITETLLTISPTAINEALLPDGRFKRTLARLGRVLVGNPVDFSLTGKPIMSTGAQIFIEQVGDPKEAQESWQKHGQGTFSVKASAWKQALAAQKQPN